MIKRKNIIKIAIDSPAAAGAGTQAKLISKHYKLFYLDTGKIYRFIGKLKLENKDKFNYRMIKSKIKHMNMANLKSKELLSNEVAISASIIAKDKKIRDIVHKFQQKSFAVYEELTESYNVVSLQLGLKLNKKFNCSLAINNLLIEEYSPHISRVRGVAGGVPSPGRYFNINLKYEF